MSGSWPEGRLVEWSLGTFHTGFFFTILVTLLYVTGALGPLLANLNTALGLAAFAWLWFTTWWCTRRAIRGAGRTAWEPRTEFWRIIGRATLWGGVNGVVFLLGVIVIATVVSILSLDAETIANLFLLLPAGLIASAIACVIGLLIGLILGLIDSVLLEVSRRILLTMRVADR